MNRQYLMIFCELNQQILNRIDDYVQEVFNDEQYNTNRNYNVQAVYLVKWHVDPNAGGYVYFTVATDFNTDIDKQTKYNDFKIAWDDFLKNEAK